MTGFTHHPLVAEAVVTIRVFQVGEAVKSHDVWILTQTHNFSSLSNPQKCIFTVYPKQLNGVVFSTHKQTHTVAADISILI